ncbi:pyridoxamine 5'-phosphate oxidase [Candidimonas nitroreducens]|uniref:Pyridoxine/pyridoxamine 5'-phosphate oxidase n=1 Tax=Candidimonas nitroreducens TaxID=683354 RepID=A0A225MKT3_9BURK|nr:pyridoxamine 5'-phosphate oxidase [Candidimonas nitroreducens]OWT61805.1 pyridoxamine 5'-phosphate oxidase [Candidimonas nitroreducens]
MSVADIRQSYEKNVLLESALASTPLEQFSLWFEEALKAGAVEPTAMTLATCDAQGRPSARIVLLKGYDERGFVFYTNYESRKGTELAANPYASLLFFWPLLERQVRIEGRVGKISAEESTAYYDSRPLGSRIGAWASPQSQPISRDQLEARTREFTQSLGEHPPRPEHWGGYRLAPERVEFWQGRPSRLHDRLVFLKNAQQQWANVRLAP